MTAGRRGCERPDARSGKEPRRRVRAVLLVAAVIVATVGQNAPARAQLSPVGEWTLTTDPVTVRRDGVAYLMRITAWKPDSSGGVWVNVALAQSTDADAATTRTVEWSFRSLPREAFEPTADLATAAVATGRRMGRYGRFRLSFSEDGRLRTNCGGHVSTRRGILGGTVAFDTGTTSFGTIRARPDAATLTFTDGECADGRTPGATVACPTPGDDVNGSRFSLSRDRGARVLRFAAGWSESLRGVRYASLAHRIETTLRAADAALNVRSAEFDLRHTAWLRGSARFSASGSAVEWPPASCGTGQQFSRVMYDGSWRGDAVARSLLGPEVSLFDTGRQGRSWRTSVDDG